MGGEGWIWILMASIIFFIICLIRPGMDELETVDVVVSI